MSFKSDFKTCSSTCSSSSTSSSPFLVVSSSSFRVFTSPFRILFSSSGPAPFFPGSGTSTPASRSFYWNGENQLKWIFGKSAHDVCNQQCDNVSVGVWRRCVWNEAEQRLNISTWCNSSVSSTCGRLYRWSSSVCTQVRFSDQLHVD